MSYTEYKNQNQLFFNLIADAVIAGLDSVNIIALNTADWRTVLRKRIFGQVINFMCDLPLNFFGQPGQGF